ncbi:MAG TPA: transporter substrate-binding domain-containing protein [Anaerolineaceae bacterium]|nr:transporter substrate-binding domain-containing protein [Anaerolineaceae bacterium]
MHKFGVGKNLLILLLFVAFILAGCAPANMVSVAKSKSSPGLLGSVLEKKVLVIATDASYPPQSELHANLPRAQDTSCDPSTFTANQLSGFDVDVAVEIARRLGVEPCFVTPGWSQIIAGNWDGRWDVSIGSMVITKDRMQTLLFTQPYISGAAVLFVQKDNPQFTRPSDLSGKKIGVCAGCAYESYLKGTLTIPGEKIDFKIKDAIIVGYDTDTSALKALGENTGDHLDAVMTDPDTGRLAIQSGLPLKELPEVVYHDYSGIALDKKSVEDPYPFLEKLNGLVQEMHQDGTLLALSQKYYHGDFTSPAKIFDINSLHQVP